MEDFSNLFEPVKKVDFPNSDEIKKQDTPLDGNKNVFSTDEQKAAPESPNIILPDSENGEKAKSEEKVLSEKKEGKAEQHSDAFANLSGEAICDEITSLKKSIDSLQAEYRNLVTSLKSAVAQNQRNEDYIHKELEQARKGEYYCTIKPFLNFMIEMHIELSNIAREYKYDKENAIQEYGEKAYNEIVGYIDMLLQMTENQIVMQGMEMLKYSAGSDYDPLEHEVASRPAESTEPGMKGKLAEVITPCYKYNEIVVRKAKVRLYK